MLFYFKIHNSEFIIKQITFLFRKKLKELKKLSILICIFCFSQINAKAQVGFLNESPSKFEFDGQASVYGSYSPKNDLDMFIGFRYLPELNYEYSFQNQTKLDFELAANMYASNLFHPFDSSKTDGDIKPYRIWGRFSGEQYEVRLGLQKIDFGPAMILRSLQWFDEMDPRDPLKFTTGVYGGLGRFYFLNNANIWTWVLYGNENPRGFESLRNTKDKPEFGGRVQIPVPKGEFAATFHHRNANSEGLTGIPSFGTIPENRFALDGKWDIEVGFWFEAVHINKTRTIGILTNQTYVTLGMDYTFAVGNGLGLTFEHLHASYDEKALAFKNNSNFSATAISYPLGFFDTISIISNLSWKTNDVAFFVDYEHQFDKFVGHFMAYYNPDTASGFGSAQLENSFSGFGARLMLVYNH